MQASRFHDEGGPVSSAARASLDEQGATSGTFVRSAAFDRVAEAHRLASEIERLLAPESPEAVASEPYGRRLTRALVRSLIDSLGDLKRDARSRSA